MTERPILFSGPMVRALLDGRKRQTRRAMKPQPNNPETFGISPIWGHGLHEKGGLAGKFCVHAAFNVGGKRVDRFLPCPYGVPGDRLWTRETWCKIQRGVRYRADLHEHADSRLHWKPSIHMPRWASRLTLEITGVRVERVQEISKADCIAEGMADLADVHAGWHQSYAQLWDSLNAKRGYPWASNCWVWVLEFQRADAAPGERT